MTFTLIFKLCFQAVIIKMRILTLIVLLALSGCSTPKQPEIGRGEIHVPSAFHADPGWMDEGDSDYERYMQMYKKGYWECVKTYIANINYVPKKSDTYASGWMSEILGYSDGYFAAERDMKRNFARFGKPRTAEYLKLVADGGGF